MSWDPCVSTSKNRSECRKCPNSVAGFRRPIAPADAITLRCNHSTSHVNEKRAAARHWNSRQRENLTILTTKTVHQRQYVRKLRVFKIVASWTTVAWQRITFPFRNAQNWYVGKIKSKHIVTTWRRRFHEIHLFQHRKNESEGRKHIDSMAGFRGTIPMLMQLRFGATTLRTMWMKSAPPPSIEIRASNNIWAY